MQERIAEKLVGIYVIILVGLAILVRQEPAFGQSLGFLLDRLLRQLAGLAG